MLLGCRLAWGAGGGVLMGLLLVLGFPGWWSELTISGADGLAAGMMVAELSSLERGVAVERVSVAGEAGSVSSGTGAGAGAVVGVAGAVTGVAAGIAVAIAGRAELYRCAITARSRKSTNPSPLKSPSARGARAGAL